ncbi:hypothetical protein ES288_A06G209900v1, partial [Gossypium darwinii]
LSHSSLIQHNKTIQRFERTTAAAMAKKISITKKALIPSLIKPSRMSKGTSALKDKQKFIDIIETVYHGARKGRGLVIALKDYSTKYRY